METLLAAAWSTRSIVNKMHLRTLLNRITPEMNHLLTSPPHDSRGGTDFGWFCREHALVTKVVCEHLAIDCDIIRGDITLYANGKKRLSTASTDTDHVWCRINNIVPCDLSMTLRYFPIKPDLNPPIIGDKNHGPYFIHYAKGASAPTVTKDCAIVFHEKTILDHTIHDYDSNPMLLLEHRESGKISFAVAQHLINRLAGRACSLMKMSQQSALTLIIDRHKPN